MAKVVLHKYMYSFTMSDLNFRYKRLDNVDLPDFVSWQRKKMVDPGCFPVQKLICYTYLLLTLLSVERICSPKREACHLSNFFPLKKKIWLLVKPFFISANFTSKAHYFLRVPTLVLKLGKCLEFANCMPRQGKRFFCLFFFFLRKKTTNGSVISINRFWHVYAKIKTLYQYLQWYTNLHKRIFKRLTNCTIIV